MTKKKRDPRLAQVPGQDEAQDTLTAIKYGEIDALVIHGPEGEKVYTLRGAEHPYRTMVETMNEGALTVSVEGLILYANLRFAEVVRMPLEKVIGRHLGDFVAPYDQDPLSALLASSATCAGRQELRLVAADGAQVPVHFSTQPLTSDNLHGVCIIVTDLTQVRADSQARLRLAAIVESSDDAIVSTCLAGLIHTWNAGAEQIYGYTSGQMVGQPLAVLSPPERAGELEAILDRLRQGERLKHYETVHVCQDGQRVDVSMTLSPIREAGGTISGAAVIVHDISERKQAEQTLRRYAERLAVIGHLNQVISSSLDIDQVYAMFVQQVARLIPFDRTAILLLDETQGQWQIVSQWGQRVATLPTGAWQPTEGSVLSWVMAHRRPLLVDEIAQSDPWGQEDWLHHEGIHACALLPLFVKDQLIGALLWGSQQPAAYSAEDLDVLYPLAGQMAIAIQNARLYDQVQRYSQELECRVAERTAELETANRELEAFSYSVSHDLRAPLRGVEGMAHILLEEHADQLSDQARYYLDMLRDNAHQMAHLIDDLLAFSRLSRQPLRRQPVDMAELVHQAVSSVQDERPVELVIGPLVACQADPALLKQVLVNLLSNAFKFTRTRPVARIEIGSQVKDGHCLYFVKDNGVGFDMRYANKLFGVFQRLHSAKEYEGTGVGLANVQRIITRHGGQVWAEAEVNQGATFYFTLPAS